ncbi:hypothetical protein FOS14_23855 [Skermania sp. ID1734]|nr:hypothetical protein FOS14_23855 [Skermania sp. ID1734]
MNTMCRAVTCRKCGKPTWAGCGQHVDQVMRSIPKSKRCQGHQGEPGAVRAFLSRMFSKG